MGRSSPTAPFRSPIRRPAKLPFIPRPSSIVPRPFSTTSGGAKPATVDDKGRLIYMHDDGLFLVTTPINGEPASTANGGTIGFSCASQEQVDSWHAAGVANGGTSCEDPPGIRESGFGPLYLAYVLDPDGNKLCGMFRAG